MIVLAISYYIHSYLLLSQATVNFLHHNINRIRSFSCSSVIRRLGLQLNVTSFSYHFVVLGCNFGILETLIFILVSYHYDVPIVPILTTVIR